MTYQECLHSTFVDFESWVIALVGLAAFLALWRFGKRVFAAVSLCLALLVAVASAGLYYELNCVELCSLQGISAEW